MRHALEAYLGEVFGQDARLTEFRRLGAGVHGTGFLVGVETPGGKRSYVLKNLSSEGLGHDYPSDRAAVLLLAFHEYGNLPLHVKAVDVLSLQKNGSLRSISGGKEYFLLMEKVEGISYLRDLVEMKEHIRLTAEGEKKIRVLAQYLSGIHAVKKDSKSLYWRKVRDTIGHGECLMGVFDSYPEGVLSFQEMAEIEKRCVDWRARLKPFHQRLCQIHGDFHPGNIWFHGKDLVLLDRSRGPWGDPADDVTALTINFIFFSLKYRKTVTGPYREALNLFFDHYIGISGDGDLLSCLGPFFAFRGAVVANPNFYPDLGQEQRTMIFRFVRNVLAADRFDPRKIEEYL